MSKKASLTRTATLSLALIVAASLTVLRAGQAPAGSVSIDGDDIGGVVTGAKGPEAGVWVIAETRDTPTRLIKSVVTDDRGRYLVPDLPKASYDVWVRGYGLVDSPKIEGDARHAPQFESGGRAERESGGGVLPGAVLVRAAAGAADDRLSRHRPAGQRHRAQHQEPGRVDPPGHQHRRLQRLSSTRRQGDARASAGLRERQDVSGRVGSPHSGRAGRRRDEQPILPGRPRARAGDVRGLDRSHCRRRAADRHAGASAGPGAQRRGHDVGLGRSEDLRPR